MLSEKDQPRQASLFHRAYPALGKRIQVRAACRQLQGLDLAGLDHLAKHRTELAVAIVQPVATVCQKAPILHRYVSRLLLHPLLVRIRRDPGRAHAPRLQLDEEKHVIRDQTFEGKDFHGEEVGPGQHLHVRANEVAPARRMLALWRRGNAMALENITRPGRSASTLTFETGDHPSTR